MSEKFPALLSRCYAPAVLSRLGRLPASDQSPIASWLIQNPIGTNYAMQILERLEDLGRREQTAPAKLLFLTLASLTTGQLQPKEIGRRVREELDRRAHPQSSLHLDTFQEWARRVGLPEEAKLIPPQNFEGRCFNLMLPFSSTDELRKKLRQSLTVLEQPEWEKIWSF